jgi:hypothetical protein
MTTKSRRAEQHILDLLGSDLVPCDVGDTVRVPQHAINPHPEDCTSAWYGMRAIFSRHWRLMRALVLSLR